LALTAEGAALGVDRVSAAAYEANLAENVKQLVERLKRKCYRAKLVRRHYIPKGNGDMRPLGIPATEDKLQQLAVKRLLEAILVVHSITIYGRGFPSAYLVVTHEFECVNFA